MTNYGHSQGLVCGIRMLGLLGLQDGLGTRRGSAFSGGMTFTGQDRRPRSPTGCQLTWQGHCYGLATRLGVIPTDFAVFRVLGPFLGYPQKPPKSKKGVLP